MVAQKRDLEDKLRRAEADRRTLADHVANLDNLLVRASARLQTAQQLKQEVPKDLLQTFTNDFTKVQQARAQSTQRFQAITQAQLKLVGALESLQALSQRIK